MERLIDHTLLLSGLMRALEGSQSETQQHAVRVAEATSRFAHLTGFVGVELEQVVLGAFAHDIGKITLSSEVVLKAGEFTVAERKLIETHTLRGVEIGLQLGLPRISLEVIRSHHERLDGSGYPDGLSGDSIPLSAQIFSIIDVYDALRSARAYKSAWTHQRALAWITERSNVLWAAPIVELFTTSVTLFELWQEQPSADHKQLLLV